MAINWSTLFDNFGIKKVTETDKSRRAYVPNEDQCSAIEAAGIAPATTRPTPAIYLTVMFDNSRTVLKSGYYHSTRSTEAARTPEPRMGKDLISTWLNPGDEVLIGNIGAQLFICKLNLILPTAELATQEIASRSTRKTIIARAKAAAGLPEKRTITRTEFSRNPFVILGALDRAGGKCETPGCKHALFKKDDGTPYLEVHHIEPLSNGGHDTLINVASLCPHCHRQLHYGINRAALRTTLQHHIAGKILS